MFITDAAFGRESASAFLKSRAQVKGRDICHAPLVWALPSSQGTSKHREDTPRSLPTFISLILKYMARGRCFVTTLCDGAERSDRENGREFCIDFVAGDRQTIRVAISALWIPATCTAFASL